MPIVDNFFPKRQKRGFLGIKTGRNTRSEQTKRQKIKLRKRASGFAQVGEELRRACKSRFTPHLRKAAFPKPMGADGGRNRENKKGKMFFSFCGWLTVPMNANSSGTKARRIKKLLVFFPKLL